MEEPIVISGSEAAIDVILGARNAEVKPLMTIPVPEGAIDKVLPWTVIALPGTKVCPFTTYSDDVCENGSEYLIAESWVGAVMLAVALLTRPTDADDSAVGIGIAEVTLLTTVPVAVDASGTVVPETVISVSRESV